MGIRIRTVDLQCERDGVLRFLYENLTPQYDRFRFDWLYLQNPHGAARAWMATDSVTGEPIGFAAAFPRCLWIDGKVHRAWVLGDFCIAKEFRTLGPALQLQRACLAALANDGSAVCYDFPSASMMSIYRRLGVPLFGEVVRYIKLIRVDGKVQQFIGNGVLARGISVAGNLWLSSQRVSTPSGDTEFRLHDGPFGPEFTSLVSRVKEFYPVHGLRTAEYLNWRYRQHPAKQFRVITARRHQELLGYVVVEISASSAILADLYATEEPGTASGLLGSLERLLEKEKIHTLTAPVLAGSRLIPYLERTGFLARERAPVAVHVDGEVKSSHVIHDSKNWLLLYGDRDS
jgi:hypothetical protein